MIKTINIKRPIATYQEYLDKYGLMNARKLAYELFDTEYFRPVPKDITKYGGIYNFKGLIPGRTFTFRYDPKYKDILDFYDRRPIILCIDTFIHPTTKNFLQLGINFNFIPSEIRILMIEKLYEAYEKFIEYDLKYRVTDRVGRVRPVFTDTYDYWEVLNYLLETISKSAFRFAVRLYIWNRMYNVSLIDYDAWGLIPMIETKDVTGETLGEIYKRYWAYKKAQMSKHPLGRPGQRKYVMQEKLIERAKKKKRKRGWI